MTPAGDQRSRSAFLSAALKVNLVAVAVFAAAFGIVEATVVVYLRELYYPGGFSLPLSPMPATMIWIEIAREASTLIMLAAVGVLAGSSRWQRFSMFMIAFGVWDIVYYIWLMVVLGWPSSIFDWDILFLIPLPWIGPVIAPVIISILLIVTGVLLLRAESEHHAIRIPPLVWVLAVAGTGLILYSFMRDTDATLRFSLPRPYRYDLLAVGILSYVIGLVLTLRETSGSHDREIEEQEPTGRRKRTTKRS